MKNRFKGILLLCTMIILAVAGCGKNDVKTEEEKTEFFGMNTYITFSAYGKKADEALKQAETRMKELESIWSVTDENSEIYRMNHSGGQPVPISADTAEIIAYGLDMAADTEGALDPTIYPILTAWGFTTGNNRIPAQEEIKELLSKTGYERVLLKENTIQLPDGMELDLGAVGKGYAGDIITELLKSEGITSALLDIGGNIQAIGSKPNGEAWTLGIRNPFGEGTLGILSVKDKAVITSGGYERYFVGEDGKEYSHILNPGTGYPVENELAAVTIITEEGKAGDALSTAMYVKGLEGAVKYWREHRNFEMIAVTDNGELYITEGAAKDFSLSDTFSNMKYNTITEE